MPHAFADIFRVARPVIGMLHLPPLPGSPLFSRDIKAIRRHMLADLESLLAGGVHGLMLENYGDIPFYPGAAPSHVVAMMSVLASEVRRRTELPLGINVLRNDGRSALAIAHAASARFIRVNVLCGARVTDQGIINGIAHDLMRDRAMLKSDVLVFADIDVKHSAPLALQPIADEVDDTMNRGLAHALIVTGSATGKRTDPDRVREVKQAAAHVPVFIGSGVNPESIQEYHSFCDGFIVGTWIKTHGLVDVAKVRAVVNAAEGSKV